MLLTVAAKSLLQRRLAAALIIIAMTLSIVALLITRAASSELRSSFASSVSGTDLIVGARANPMQVLLYSVFRLGTPTQAVTAERWASVAQLPQVDWSFPLVLGDSVNGFAVIGTDDDYFSHFRFGNKHSLAASDGSELRFRQPTSAIIGATAARELGLKTGDAIILSHGTHKHSFHQHKELPFIVSTILQPTGTPVDRSIHVHLATLEALHNEKWLHHFIHHDHDADHDQDEHEEHAGHDHDEHEEHAGHDHDEHADHDHDEHEEHADHDHDEHEEHADHDSDGHDEHADHDHDEHEEHADHDHDEHDEHAGHDHDEHADHDEHEQENAQPVTLHFEDLPAPTAISAVFVGLKSRALTFQAQSAINAANAEPLTAVIPGVALTEFWQLIGNAEQILKVLSALMLITGLLGSVAMLQVSVAFRAQEIGLLRLIGAHPFTIFMLLQAEILLLTVSSWVFALILSGLLQTLAGPVVAQHFGVLLNPQWWPEGTHWLLLISLLLSVIAGLIPAITAYRKSAHSGR